MNGQDQLDARRKKLAETPVLGSLLTSVHDTLIGRGSAGNAKGKGGQARERGVGGHEHDNHDSAAVDRHIQHIDAADKKRQSFGADSKDMLLHSATGGEVSAKDTVIDVTDVVDESEIAAEEQFEEWVQEEHVGESEEEQEEQELEEWVDPEQEEQLEDEEETDLLFEEEGSVLDGRTDLHVAAAAGDVDEVERLLGNQHTDLMTVRDANGWQAIHEAARGGHLDVVRYAFRYDSDLLCLFDLFRH